MSSKRTPETLRAFLRSLIKSDLKIKSIGQCIAKSVSFRLLMPPILFTLAVELDHVSGSRWLINQLHKLGFCESYDQVLKFKQAVVINESIDDLLQNDEGFTTFVVDNVDHNIATLDGSGTFHGMGAITVIMKKEQRREVVRRRQKDWIKVDNLVKNKVYQFQLMIFRLSVD